VTLPANEFDFDFSISSSLSLCSFNTCELLENINDVLGAPKTDDTAVVLPVNELENDSSVSSSSSLCSINTCELMGDIENLLGPSEISSDMFKTDISMAIKPVTIDGSAHAVISMPTIRNEMNIESTEHLVENDNDVLGKRKIIANNKDKISTEAFPRSVTGTEKANNPESAISHKGYAEICPAKDIRSAENMAITDAVASRGKLAVKPHVIRETTQSATPGENSSVALNISNSNKTCAVAATRCATNTVNVASKRARVLKRYPIPMENSAMVCDKPTGIIYSVVTGETISTTNNILSTPSGSQIAQARPDVVRVSTAIMSSTNVSPSAFPKYQTTRIVTVPTGSSKMLQIVLNEHHSMTVDNGQKSLKRPFPFQKSDDEIKMKSRLLEKDRDNDHVHDDILDLQRMADKFADKSKGKIKYIDLQYTLGNVLI